jgi:hypothetical protein
MHIDTDRQNREIVQFVQACRAELSRNVIYAAIGFIQNRLVVVFALEQESVEDREAIEDVLTEFESLHAGPIDVDVDVRILGKDCKVDPPDTPFFSTYVRKGSL